MKIRDNPWRRKNLAGALFALLLVGCDQKPTEPVESRPLNVGGRIEEADATVWRNEVLARSYERFFVTLADDLRRSSDKAEILSRIPLEQITIPRPFGKPVKLDYGIEEQRFDNSVALTLNRDKWIAAVQQFKQAGWRLEQFQWQYENFFPATNAVSAASRFDFEFHLKREQARAVVRGELFVSWNSEKLPGILTVSNLTFLERTGAPGFSNHAIIAPEPANPGGQVNLHPLIVLDINGDRHLDIILPGVNTVLVNDGSAQFSARALVEGGYPFKSAALVADITDDGHPDLIGVPQNGPLADMLAVFPGHGGVPFRGEGRVAWEAQRQDFQRYRFISPSVLTAGDVDGDNDLDLFIGQYRAPYTDGNLPEPYYDANDGHPSRLLINGGEGRFQLAGSQPAFERKSNRRMLAASLVDIDADGDTDLLTVNDFCGLDLFLNEGRGVFVDKTDLFTDRHLFGMGHRYADFNDDGRLDLLAIGMDTAVVRRLETLGLRPRDTESITGMRRAMAYGNRLFLAEGNGFQEPSWAGALARGGWAWGTSVFDLENDGDVDIYLANGHVSGKSSEDYDTFYWTRDIYLKPNAEVKKYLDKSLEGLNRGETSWNGYQFNRLFLNVGDHRYKDAAFLMGVAHQTDCRAVVSADLNSDGRMDLLLTEAIWQGSPHKMRHRLLIHLNEIASTNSWIGAQLAGKTIGASVTLKTNHRLRTAQITTGDSFQSQHPPVAHFGLAKGELAEELTVRWPDGRTERLSQPEASKYHYIRSK